MHQCSQCEETIRNPICPDCLSEGIAAAIGERTTPDVAQDVFFMTSFLKYPVGNVWCIKCGNRTQICAHCYTGAVMENLAANPILLAHIEELCSFTFEKRFTERKLIH